MESLKLTLLGPEYVTAGFRGSQLRACAVITNQGDHAVPIRGAHLVGSETKRRISWMTTAPASIDAGASVDCPIRRPWRTARRLRRDPALYLEVERDSRQTVRSAEVEIEDTREWTPEDEVKAALIVPVVGILWWFLYVPLLDLPRAPQVVAWALLATACAATCSVFYVALWRGDAMQGIGLAIGRGRRVRPLTEVLLTSVAVWFVLTAPFAFGTYLIDGELADGTRMDRYFEAISLYAWHAADVLPFVKATDTLKWDEPLRDYSHATGALLLLYKLLVLAPVVAAGQAAWRLRTPHEPPENAVPEATSHAADVPGAQGAGT